MPRNVSRHSKKKSGLFDGQGNIVKGKEIFYYKKGMYLLGTGKTDSAEYYFRKLLKCDYDLNNVEAAHKGLLSLYNKLGNPDSIYKYSTLYCATNDSSGIDIVKKTADEWTATMKDRGNETGLPMRHSSKTKGILLLLTVLFVALSVTFYRTRRKKEAIHEETSADKKECFIQEDVQEAKNVELAATTDVHDNEFAGLVEFAHECASDCLTASENMTDLHWLKLESHMHEQFATFYEYVCRHKLSANEKHAVILTKLGFSASEIQNLIDIRGNSFTNLKSRAGKKLFDSDSTRSFKKNVTELGEPFPG